ncbi:MAG TPA: hypothetical protein VEH29_00370 [Acidimicrobiales bacterium]|nr:hypothetical protein [Acidimicrobiales bacterium]
MPATENAPSLPWARADWGAAGLLVGLPAVVLASAAAAGYPLITGDDVVQNYPLEYLSGLVLRHGHLPLYDAFLWSGTPLLGGTNAHALLPITMLFALLPPLAAWVVGEIAVFSAAAVGCQLFLRRTGCGSLAAALAGASFGLGGFVSSQIVHVDFAAAAAALPWMLVALHGLATRPPSSRRSHCLLLAGTLAWICLCGSPDIVIDTVVVFAAYLVHLVLQPLAAERRLAGRVRLCTWAVAGAAIGVAIGALQWVPSASFVSASERAHPSFAYISGGSLDGANFLELLVPHVLGGGLLGSRAFGGTFPLAEVDAYPGVIALAGLFALLVSWRQADAWRWRVWLVVCALALLIVSGDHTPLEHVIAKLPVIGDQRLPSRGLIGFALSVSLLGGYFLDSLLASQPTRRQVAAGLVPLAGILGVVLATVITGRPAGGALVAHAGTGWTLRGVIPDLLLSTLLAAAAAALLLFGRRLQGRRRTFVVAALVVVDLVGFDINQSSLAPEYASALSPSDHAAVAALSGAGRYLVVDPQLRHALALDQVGAPDLGVISELEDAGGYGSLTWGPYASATGTHIQDGVLEAALATGTLSTLGVRALLTLPSELVSSANGSTGSYAVGSGTSMARWFGAPVTVSEITLRAVGTAPGVSLHELAQSLELLGDGGRRVTTAAEAAEVRAGGAADDEVTVHFAPPVTAVGLELGGSPLHTSLRITEPVVRPEGQAPFATGGLLAAAVGGRGWTEVAGVAGFSVLVNGAAAPPYRVTGGGAVRVLSSDPLTGSATVQVSTPAPAALVRTVADVPGWHASLEHAGRESPAAVRDDGLVQSVAVPAGESTVTFVYVAPGWATGQLLALGGGLAVAGLLLAPAAGRVRRRRISAAGVRSPPRA